MLTLTAKLSQAAIVEKKDYETGAIIKETVLQFEDQKRTGELFFRKMAADISVAEHWIKAQGQMVTCVVAEWSVTGKDGKARYGISLADKKSLPTVVSPKPVNQSPDVTIRTGIPASAPASRPA